MKKLNYWNLDKFSLMVARTLLNKFDCFIIIEGMRGLGKSTLAWHIGKKVNNIFLRIVKETGGEESPYYNHHLFKPSKQLKFPEKYKYIVYKRDDVINFFDKWHQTAIADEMINVAFNREFWSEDQKNLIKLINMNRDHCNLLIACVPQFQVLDNQIKNLCKIRITVSRRGLAVIQTPNRTIYNKDRWDTANNERIEREWLRKGTGLPQYSRLNTFRAMMKFPALSLEEQKIYDKIKFLERNTIKKDLGVDEEKEKKEDKKEDPLEKIYNRLINGQIRNAQVLDGFADAIGMTGNSLKNKLAKRLMKENRPSILSSYYWDGKKLFPRREKQTNEIFSIIK